MYGQDKQDVEIENRQPRMHTNERKQDTDFTNSHGRTLIR